MHTMRVEFEDLGFKAMHPMRSERIRAAVRRARGNRNEIVEKIEQSLIHCLERDGLEGEVLGREKHLYSIYKKMRGKRKAFHEIMDVYAFRIVVDKVDTCYRVLGAVHSLYKPLPGDSRTTSRSPRPTVTSRCTPPCSACTACPSRSRSAPAKWKRWPTTASPRTGCTNPTRMKCPRAPTPAHGNGSRACWSCSSAPATRWNSSSVKIDLFPDEVYVFTPKGRIMELPKGSTAVDFAYAVHTDVGNTCIACRVNRRLAPLSQPLESGSTVEIVTAPGLGRTRRG